MANVGLLFIFLVVLADAHWLSALMVLRGFIWLWAFAVCIEGLLRFEASLRSGWRKCNLPWR